MKITQYLLPPTWKGVEMKYIDDKKGHGLFATCTLQRGTAIPYYGRMGQKAPDTSTERYVVEVIKHQLYIDGNPELNTTSEVWLGSYINEPDLDNRANARLQVSNRGRPNGPSGAYAHVVLVQTVQAGTEITFCYGKHYDRTHY